MRCITYAGEHLVTSGEVADVMVELTAALAALGRAEAVQIPIYPEGEKYPGSEDALELVSLVIGPGTDLLSSPYDWDGPDPDFSDAATELKAKLRSLRPEVVVLSNRDTSHLEHDSRFDPETWLDPDPTNF